MSQEVPIVRSLKFVPMAGVIWLCGLNGAAAASFPCEKAATSVEKMICANTKVSELDEYLGRYYSAARAELGRGKNCLANNQKDWLRTVRNPCKDAKCLERVYLARLAELDALQPGATALRNIELPRVDALVWIVPPAEDTVAAPPVSATAPGLRIRGKIVDDIATGDGIAIQDAAGRKHPVLLLMFMEKSSSVALESLIGSPGVYEARGSTEKSADGSTHFAPGACTFFYRVAQ
jgi:uncharacterized protein